MERKWAYKFLKEGSLRIGNLHSFRDEEAHGSEVGDSLEGIKQVKSNSLTYIDTGKPERIPYWMKQKINVQEPNRLVIHARDGMGSRYSDPDSYIFCVTDVFDKRSMVEMGYSCSILINDSDAFFKAITMKLKNKAEFWGAAKCVYRSREVEDTEDKIPASFIKEKRYKHQNEVRGLWLPKTNQAISPINIKVKKAAKVCELYA